MTTISIEMLSKLGNDEQASLNCVALVEQCGDLPEYLLQVGTEYVKQFIETVAADEPDANLVDVMGGALATWYVRVLEVGVRLGREMERADNSTVAEFQIPDTLPEDLT